MRKGDFDNRLRGLIILGYVLAALSAAFVFQRSIGPNAPVTGEMVREALNATGAFPGRRVMVEKSARFSASHLGLIPEIRLWLSGREKPMDYMKAPYAMDYLLSGQDGEISATFNLVDHAVVSCWVSGSTRQERESVAERVHQKFPQLRVSVE